MTGVHDLALFVAAGLLLNLTPGPDLAYIAARSVGGRIPRRCAAVFGITAGCVVHTLAAALGLSVLLATSATAFKFVRWCGAPISPMPGIRLLVASSREPARAEVSEPAAARWLRRFPILGHGKAAADLPRGAADQRLQSEGRAVLPRVRSAVHRERGAGQGARRSCCSARFSISTACSSTCRSPGSRAAPVAACGTTRADCAGCNGQPAPCSSRSRRASRRSRGIDRARRYGYPYRGPRCPSSKRSSIRAIRRSPAIATQ